MKKFLLAACAAVGVFLISGGGSALAAHCFNVNKPLGAGEQGIFFNLSEVGGPNIDVYDFQCNEGQGLVCEEVAPGVFVASLPDAARNAGPGDSGCDGVGIDDALDCP